MAEKTRKRSMLTIRLVCAALLGVVADGVPMRSTSETLVATSSDNRAK